MTFEKRKEVPEKVYGGEERVMLGQKMAAHARADVQNPSCVIQLSLAHDLLIVRNDLFFSRN